MSPTTRAASKAAKLNDDHAGKPRKSATVLSTEVLTGVQTNVVMPARTRTGTSPNHGVLTGLVELVTPLAIGDTFRLNAPESEDGQSTLASLVRKAVERVHGYDMGVGVAIADGFMFVELKKRAVRTRKS